MVSQSTCNLRFIRIALSWVSMINKNNQETHSIASNCKTLTQARPINIVKVLSYCLQAYVMYHFSITRIIGTFPERIYLQCIGESAQLLYNLEKIRLCLNQAVYLWIIFVTPFTYTHSQIKELSIMLSLGQRGQYVIIVPLLCPVLENVDPLSPVNQFSCKLTLHLFNISICNRYG